MDGHTDVPEVLGSKRTDSPLRALKIVPVEWDPARLQWLWKCLMTQEYAFDDFAHKIGAHAFLGQIFLPTSLWYELGDVGIACFTSIQQDSGCNFHFALWDEPDVRECMSVIRSLFHMMYEEFNLRRITAFIPAINKPAIRAAVINGFKYEGEMRKAFLKHGTWHNLHIYGLLREEFAKRGVIN